jgi:hypothetical protein
VLDKFANHADQSGFIVLALQFGILYKLIGNRGKAERKKFLLDILQAQAIDFLVGCSLLFRY